MDVRPQMSYELVEEPRGSYQPRIVKEEIETSRCAALSEQEWQSYISLILEDFTRRDFERGLGVSQSGINTVLIPRSQTSLHNSASVQEHLDLYHRNDAPPHKPYWKTACEWRSTIQEMTIKFNMAQLTFFIPFQMLPTTWEGGLALRLVLVDVSIVAELAVEIRRLLAAAQKPNFSPTICTRWPGVVVQGMINVDDLRPCAVEPNRVWTCRCPECTFGLRLMNNWLRSDSERMAVAEGYLCDLEAIRTEDMRSFTRGLGSRHDKCMTVDADARKVLTNPVTTGTASENNNARRPLPFILSECSTDTLRFLVLALSRSIAIVELNVTSDQDAIAAEHSKTLGWLLTNPPICTRLHPTLVAPWLLLCNSELVALPAVEYKVELQPDRAFVPATRANCLRLCRKLLGL